MHDRTEWTRGQAGDIKVKNRTYKNLVEFSRPCATCQKPFSIYVTNKIAGGHADSNSFGLKNCPEHRRNKATGDLSDVEALRMANSVMKQELAGLYARDKDQFAELQELKARLASYELQGAMSAVAEDPYLLFGQGPRHAPGTAMAQKDEFLDGIMNRNKMPWEQNSS